MRILFYRYREQGYTGEKKDGVYMMEMKKNKQMLLKLFFSTLYLSAFTFGGGYVIITLMKKKFVDEYHWIEEEEMLDLVAIAQSSPGPIAVNGAIVVGYKLAGAAGIVVSIIGTVLPPFVILTILSFFYEAFQSNFYVKSMLDGMQCAVAAVIASVVYDMGKGVVQGKSWMSNLIMGGAFAVTFVFDVNVIYVVLVCGGLGVLRTLWGRRGGRK